MQNLTKLTILVLIAFVFLSCNKDEYGKTRDQLLDDIEYTELEQLKGFSYWGKTWYMESIVYDGNEYFPDIDLYHTHDYEGRVDIPIIKTTHFNGSDSIEVDSIIYKIGGGAMYLSEEQIVLNIDLTKYQLQYFNYEEETYYEIINAFPDLYGTWSYNESSNELTVHNPTTGHLGIFQSDRLGFFMNVEDTTYSDFTIQILELSKEKMKLHWYDPTLEIEYTVTMNEQKTNEV